MVAINFPSSKSWLKIGESICNFLTLTYQAVGSDLQSHSQLAHHQCWWVHLPQQVNFQFGIQLRPVGKSLWMKLNTQNAHVTAVWRVCSIISLILVANDSMWKIKSNHVSNITKKKLPKATGVVKPHGYSNYAQLQIKPSESEPWLVHCFGQGNLLLQCLSPPKWVPVEIVCKAWNSGWAHGIYSY